MKSIIGYIACIISALIYTIFLDGRCGVIFLAVLIIAPIISISMTLLAKKKVDMTVESSAQMLNKGETVILSATFKKSGIIPAPFIEVSFFNAKNFITSLSKYTLSISARKPMKIQQSYTARIWGVASIGIEEVTMTDYLGLVKFNLYKERGLNEYANAIEIFPNIPDAPAKNDLVRSVCDAVAYDDNEETKENVVATSGFPGYEHKNYTPGDPIKRINWKLSSKRNELMVRLDEAIANSKQVLVLDCCNNQMNLKRPEELFSQLIQDEKIVESVLAMLKILVKQGVECLFYYFSGRAWLECYIANLNDISTLQYNLAKYKFLPQTKEVKECRVPIDVMTEQKKISTMMVFTSCYDENLYSQIQNANQMGIVTHTVVTVPTRFTAENTWIVNDTFEFKSL